jgi:lysophospholipid hydrolase
VLAAASATVKLAPHECLFSVGDPSDAGIFIVIEGRLGVYLPAAAGEGPSALQHTNTLHHGESVGDFDVVDGGLASGWMAYVALFGAR